ncbi:hypothetical protein BKA80DRAFT_251027 [Phyllosticta citrichinensis]
MSLLLRRFHRFREAGSLYLLCRSIVLLPIRVQAQLSVRIVAILPRRDVWVVRCDEDGLKQKGFLKHRALVQKSSDTDAFSNLKQTGTRFEPSQGYISGSSSSVKATAEADLFLAKDLQKAQRTVHLRT